MITVYKENIKSGNMDVVTSMPYNHYNKSKAFHKAMNKARKEQVYYFVDIPHLETEWSFRPDGSRFKNSKYLR